MIIQAVIVILEKESDSSKAREMPVLLGRPFMATAKVIIDVHKGRLSMTVLGQTAEFEVFESMKNPLKGSVCFNIASTDEDDEPHSTFGEYVALAHSEVTNKTPLLKHASSS